MRRLNVCFYYVRTTFRFWRLNHRNPFRSSADLTDKAARVLLNLFNEVGRQVDELGRGCELEMCTYLLCKI